MNRRRFLSLLGGGVAGSLIGIPAARPVATTPAYGQVIIDGGGMTIMLPGGGIMRSKIASGAVVARKIASDAVAVDGIAPGAISSHKIGVGTSC